MTDQENPFVMTIFGEVSTVKGSSTYENEYASWVRPSAKSASNLVFCEVRLDNKDEKISKVAKWATLNFIYIPEFEEGRSNISLYTGSKLVLKFKVRANFL